MKREDFYELKIKQFIHYRGVNSRVTELRDVLGRLYITLVCVGDDGHSRQERFHWEGICKDCSLEPQKKKRKIKFYRHLVGPEHQTQLTEWRENKPLCNYRCWSELQPYERRIWKTEEEDIEIEEQLCN